MRILYSMHVCIHSTIYQKIIIFQKEKWRVYSRTDFQLRLKINETLFVIRNVLTIRSDTSMTLSHNATKSRQDIIFMDPNRPEMVTHGKIKPFSFFSKKKRKKNHPQSFYLFYLFHCHPLFYS